MNLVESDQFNLRYFVFVLPLRHFLQTGGQEYSYNLVCIADCRIVAENLSKPPGAISGLLEKLATGTSVRRLGSCKHKQDMGTRQ